MFDPNKYLLDMRGKVYLEVKWRIVWFRDQHPTGRIVTDMVSAEPLIMKASVYAGDGNLLATGFGSADSEGKKVVWSGRDIEKAETAAIGRALAHAGYGTQFTGEVEGTSLADSPIEQRAPIPMPKPDVIDEAKLVAHLASAYGKSLDDLLPILGVASLAEYTAGRAALMATIRNVFKPIVEDASA